MRESKTVYLSDSYNGEKPFPDWYIDFHRKKKKNFKENSFTWEYTKNDIIENYKCDMTGYTGTLYFCHNRVIGVNNYVTFSLKSVLYHPNDNEKMEEFKELKIRLSKLSEKVTNDIKTSNETVRQQLSKLLEDIKKKQTKLKKKVVKLQKKSKGDSGSVLVFIIQMIPHNTDPHMLTKSRLIDILKSIDIDSKTIKYINELNMTQEDIQEFIRRCMNYYLPYQVQWNKTKIENNLSKGQVEQHTNQPTNTPTNQMPITITSTNTPNTQLLPRREAIDDYKMKLQVEAELRAELGEDTYVFCPVQFYWANDIEKEIAYNEFQG